MEPIHAHTVDAMTVLIQDMRRRMIHHIANKLDLDEDEMKTRYCSEPIRLKVCNTIQTNGIVIQDGPVFLDPPKPPIQKKASAPRPQVVTVQEKELTEEQTKIIQYALDDIRTETKSLVEIIGDRMCEGHIFDTKETKLILKPLYTVLNRYEERGLITKKQRMNRFNRNLTNILHGADPGKDRKLRELAKANPGEFFETLISRIQSVMIQNIL